MEKNTKKLSQQSSDFLDLFSDFLEFAEVIAINKSVDEKNPTLPTIKEELPVAVENSDNIVVARFSNVFFAQNFLAHCKEGDFTLKQ